MFFALWPEPDVATAITGRIPTQVPPQRRIAARDLHITLLFLGHISEEQRAVALEVASGIQAPPFDLVLDHVGQFARARVVWIGPALTPEPATKLATALRERLRGSLALREARDFRAHVTVARKTFLVPPPARDCDPVPWSCRDFVLAETAAEPGGGRYKVLQRWKLA
jgi:2'-5' RNA ligase